MGAFSLLMRTRFDAFGLPSRHAKPYHMTGDTEAEAIATARKFLPADRFELMSVLPIADTGLAA